METVISPISRFLLMDTGERIKLARESRGWSQADLARRVGVSQPAIKKIESGETRQSKFLPAIFKVLQIDLAELLSEQVPQEGQEFVTRIPLPELRSARDFPIHASAEGGQGQIIVSSDAVDFDVRPAPLAHVKDAYGLLITGTSMEPEYRPGDTALVNPNLPVIGGEVYIFYSEKEGEARATIKHLRHATTDRWLVSQWNPTNGHAAEFTLSRTEWQWAHRVIGKYSRP
jgi:transcriptional regulator with XRE-family HTH domain